MGKIKTVEIIVRGDIIEKNIILKLANRLRDSKLRADFNASIAVPPFLVASEKRYPSLAVLYARAGYGAASQANHGDYRIARAQ